MGSMSQKCRLNVSVRIRILAMHPLHAELIRLRAFHASVTKSLTLAAPALDDPDQLIGELKGLGSRLAFAGLQLSSALERLTISDPATGGDAPTEREIEGDGL